jgi:hypothetical protein
MGTDFNNEPAGALVVVEVAQLVSVVQPFPDDAVLRRRAYFYALDLMRRAPTRRLATDRRV